MTSGRIIMFFRLIFFLGVASFTFLFGTIAVLLQSYNIFFINKILNEKLNIQFYDVFFLLLEVNIDGASRGNPGLSAIGIIIKQNGKILMTHSEFLGIRTNNQAEYEALRRALEICNTLDKELTIFSDSELLVNQRNIKYKVRNQNLKMISREISNLEKNFEKVQYRHIAREKNNKADRLANKALDEYIKNIANNKRSSSPSP